MESAAEREEALFEAAMRMAGADRAAFLDLKCAGDSGMRRRIEALLSAHEGLRQFMPEESAAAAARVRVEPIDLEEEAVGQKIGRYKLLEKLGEGGCGVVYVAEQSVPIRRRVALKVIKLGMDTRQVVARFEAERQALALMDHPNISKVLDAGATERGRPYFVMELVRGIRITEYCDQNHVTTGERLKLMVQVCHAIQHAHQKGIIHRDIKPSNILVTLHDGIPVPKVIDFGIAKATEGRLTELTVYTQLHQLIGTPAYMSPEQAEMSALDVDTRSDIYSLGVLLYELLVGRTPFDAKRLIESGIDAMRRTIREREPLRPSTRLAGLRGEDLTETAQRRRIDPPRLVHLLRRDLDWIVMKCLEKNRTRRYETANALAMDIVRHLNDEAVVARPPSRTYRLMKTARRNTGVFVAAGLVMLALVAGMVASLSQLVRARKAEALAQRETGRARAAEKVAEEKSRSATLERNRAETSLYAADMNVVQQALSQSNLRRARERLRVHVPKAGAEDRRGWEWWFFASRAKGDDVHRVASAGSAVVAMAPLSAREEILVGWANGSVERWNAASGRSLGQAHRQTGGLKALLMDRSGEYILTQGEDGEARIWRQGAETAAKPRVVSSVALPEVARAFAPGKNLVAGVAKAMGRPELPNSDVGLIGIWDTETGAAVRTLVESGDKAVFNRNGDLLVTGSFRGVVSVWETASWTRRKVPGVGRAVHLALSPDDRWLLICTVGGVYLHDLTGEPGLNRLTQRGTAVMPMCGEFSASGGHFAVGYSDGTISVHESGTGAESAHFEGHEGPVHAVAFSNDGNSLMSADTLGAMRIFEMGAHKNRELLIGMFSPSIFSPNGRLVAVTDVSAEGVHCALWDLETGQKRELRGAANPVGFSEDGGTLITAMAAEPLPVKMARISGLQFWGVAPGKLEREVTFKVEHPMVGAVALSPDGQRIAAGDENGSVLLWNAQTGEWIATLPANSGRVWNLAFSPDGTRLAVGIIGDAAVWDLATETRIFSKPVLGTPLAFSPDGQTVAMSTETEILLCDASGKVISTLAGHRERVYWLAFSPDGRTLASAAEDVRLWSLEAERDVATFRKAGPFLHVNFSPDGSRLIAGDIGNGWIWTAPRVESPVQPEG